MRRLFDCKVLKILSHLLQILLAGLICILCTMDAPEYIRCTHIGVCEFLEVCADFTETRKLENILESISHFPRRIFTAGRNLIGRFSCFLEWLRRIVNYNLNLIQQNLIENFFWPPVVLPILERWVNPFRCEVPCPVLRIMSRVLLKDETIPPAQENKLPPPALQIVTISIIKS
ncbi:MAG: hypothetical protein AB1611_07095 [bacterium]